VNPEINLTIISVTYGDRWKYLKKNLEALHSIDFVKEIIIVNNHVNYDIANQLSGYKRCKLININENSGSAAGFAEGISYYLSSCSQNDSEKEWVMLLDDDNYIQNMDTNTFKSTLRNAEGSVFYCNRLSRQVELQNYKPLFYNSFLSFNRLSKTRIFEVDTLELLPYSGLLLSRKAIEKIGLPDKDYYLYCDDYDYSFRLAKHNILAKLLDSCTIDEMETSWNKKNNNFALSILNSDPLKVYYGIRNRIYFERKNTVSNSFLYVCNGCLFFLYVLYKNIKEKNRISFKSLLAILRAVKDGFKNKMGINSNYRLK
jgi:GT2 family glycosyltransferase